MNKTELTAAEAERVKKLEDQISMFFENTTLEFDLMTAKFWRLRHVNQSTQLSDLEFALAVERKKRAG